MRLSNKLPRILSIVTAVLLLLSLLTGFITNVISWASALKGGNSSVLVSIVTYLFSSIVSAVCIITLFRGKKDTLVGVLLIAGAVINTALTLFSSGSVILTLSLQKNLMSDMHGALMGYNVMNLLRTLAANIFYILLALECFKPGTFCASKSKIVLIVLPIVTTILAIAASVALQLPTASIDAGAFVVSICSALISCLMSCVPLLLLGITFATPVYENETPVGNLTFDM